jgi:hypothetical protein
MNNISLKVFVFARLNPSKWSKNHKLYVYRRKLWWSPELFSSCRRNESAVSLFVFCHHLRHLDGSCFAVLVVVGRRYLFAELIAVLITENFNQLWFIYCERWKSWAKTIRIKTKVINHMVQRKRFIPLKRKLEWFCWSVKVYGTPANISFIDDGAFEK